jgi:hypothetical protein
MRNLLKIFLLGIQIPLVSQVVNKTHLTPKHLATSKQSVAIKCIKPKLATDLMVDGYMGPRSKVVTGITDIKLQEITPRKEVVIAEQNLSAGETIAAAFALLKFPPPFEQATIHIPKNMTLLLTSPNAYFSKMSPLHGQAHWLQGNELSQLEPINAPNGYVVLHWPVRKLGIPKDAKLILQMDSPVIAVQYLWSDFTCYGNDITKFLLHQVGNWHYSSRYLNINRSGYREILFPTNIKDGIHHNQVGPILEPYLKQSVPQLFKKLKSE